MKPQYTIYIIIFLILALITACGKGDSSSHDTSDTEPPNIVATITPDPNAQGWHNTDVTVRFECTDNDSGIESCPADVNISVEGANQVINGTATDKAGNSASTQAILNIDKTAPVISASTLTSPNTAGWFNEDVAVSFDCSDALSGVDSCTDNLVVTTEGSDQLISGAVMDLAGNMTTTDIMLDIDKTAPVVAISTPQEAARIFGHLPPVEVEGSVNDSLSGVGSLTCNTQPVSVSGTGFQCDVDVVDGDNTITISATDEAGNVGTMDRSITYLEPELELAFVDDFQLIWSSHGSNLNAHASFFAPVAEAGFHPLGHSGYQGLVPDVNGYAIAVREVNPGSGALAPPDSYIMVWDSITTGFVSTITGGFWKPVAPDGYSCLGLLVTTPANILVPPATDAIRCVRNDLVIPGHDDDSPFDAKTLWSTGFTEATIPFLATHILPKKSDYLVSNKHAIYPGTFNGSSYTDINQAGELINWLNGEKVLHVAMPATDVEPLIQSVGPLVWLHPNEVYFPDYPENILDIASLSKAFVLFESDYDKFSIIALESADTSSSSFYDDYETFFLDDPRRFFGTDIPNPWFKTWIEYDPLFGFGDLGSTVAYVNVLPVDAIFTDIQFWFYYPFNGPGRIKVTIGGLIEEIFQLPEGGRHYGDWEHVTMRILNQTRNMTQHELVGVYLSRHSQGEWFSRKLFQPAAGFRLGFDGTHPIVYAGKYSHAFYPLVGSHLVYEVKYRASDFIRVDAFDETGFGVYFRANEEYQIINSGVEGVAVTEKNWLGFGGRWGGYELLSESYIVDSFDSVGAGPYGPNVQNHWKYGDQFDWYWKIKVTHE